MLEAELLSTDWKSRYEQLLEKYVKQQALISSLLKKNRVLELRDAPIPNWGYEWFSNLQYKVKNLTERLKAFESGDIYIEMRAKFKALLDDKDNTIKKLKNELAKANAMIVTVRENWLGVIDDIEKVHAKELAKKDSELKKMEERALNAERQRDDYKDKYLDKTREVYRVQTELEEEKEKNQNLKTQINRDHENSSISSSLKVNKKKIVNTREKSGKLPGGQPRHEYHPRKRQVPTLEEYIPVPKEFMDDPNCVETGKMITKQIVEIQVKIITTEYTTPQLRNTLTGIRFHADFPDDLTDDVTYGGSIKAFLFLLVNHCNVSIIKASDILSELTDGKLQISAGMICNLTKEFSKKTQPEQKKAFADMLLEPVMNTDFTYTRVNGENMNAIVCATPTKVLYFAREHKGHEGIKGTPVETYQNTLVHDHEKSFYKYGDNHQECNAHPLRYLKGNFENEPNMKWSLLMRDLIREMIHFRKHLDPEDKRNPNEIDPDRVKALDVRYDEILEIARKEYEYEPPSKYNKDGFNLYKRLAEYKKNHLLFLYDRRVPYSNSRSERLLRKLKRKSHQVMAFRSFAGFSYLCDCLGVVETLRSNEKNLYRSTSDIFNRQYEMAD